MKKLYDFSKGKRRAVIPAAGKTRVTIYVDDAVLKRFKAASKKTGTGYQTLINEALKFHVVEKRTRMERGRLASECAKLDPKFEKALAEEGLGSSSTWKREPFRS